jgi:hypothetical protein
MGQEKRRDEICDQMSRTHASTLKSITFFDFSNSLEMPFGRVICRLLPAFSLASPNDFADLTKAINRIRMASIPSTRYCESLMLVVCADFDTDAVPQDHKHASFDFVDVTIVVRDDVGEFPFTLGLCVGKALSQMERLGKRLSFRGFGSWAEGHALQGHGSEVVRYVSLLALFRYFF